MNETIRILQDETESRFTMFSAHDTSLAGLLGGYAVDQWNWPPYASPNELKILQDYYEDDFQTIITTSDKRARQALRKVIDDLSNRGVVL